MEANLQKKILLIGGGGHCRSVLDSLFALNTYDEIGIIDSIDRSVLGVPVVGTDNDVPCLKTKGWTDAFITVGSVGNTRPRRQLYEMVKSLGLNIPIIIDPTAVIAKEIALSEGIYVGKKAVINTGSRIGICSIINTGTIIEHDCIVGDFAHISPGATVCGQVVIGDDSHVGAGSVIRQQIRVGSGVLIGAGSIVVKNVTDNVKAYGNPCKVVE